VNARAPAAAEVGWSDINAWRLARHHLDERAPKSKLADVVADIGAVQAQVMSAAELQIAVRCECNVEDVRAALWQSKTLVKTWLMRGTLHLARATDLPIFTAAMGKRWIHINNAWLKFFNVTEDEVWKLTADIGDALDDTPKTREQVIDAVARGRPDRIKEALGSGWGGMLKPAARNGRLCFGPSRGQSVTFVSPQKWLPEWQAADPESALVDMARRYVHTYGPANKEDFAFWWGNWSGVGVAAWAGLRDELVQVDVEGWRAYVLRDDLDRIAVTPRATSRVRLLPNFDPYLMGHARRDHLFDREHSSRVSRTAGWISPVILVDGRVEGVWAYAVKSRRMNVELTPFTALRPRTVSEAKARADAIAKSMGVGLDRVTVTT
jgi:hypothetical protein